MDFPDKFQYLVLRPPQFGKTMLISMLYHFYDIHGANQFAERFGSLAVVTKASTPVRHSQHLCLSFNLLDFWVCSDRTDLVSDLPNQISHVLDSFLIKYAKELKLSPLEDYPRDEGLAVKFAKTFDLVKACGYSLFVGVDNYDAPTRRLTPAARGDFRYIPEGSATPREVQRLLIRVLESSNGCDRCLPEESDVPGAVTLNDLIHLLATGAVDIDGEKTVSLRFGCHQGGDLGHPALCWCSYLRSPVGRYLASSEQSSFVSYTLARGRLFCDRHELGVTFTTAWYHFGIASDPEPLLELLLRARRNVDPIILPPREPLHPSSRVPIETDVTFELYTLTLRGMWQAGTRMTTSRRWKLSKLCMRSSLPGGGRAARTTVRDLVATLNAVETVLVGSFFDSDSQRSPGFWRWERAEDSEEEED
ncbi:hypothetical protein K438DRAFT_1933215 [Mycena galopus ATCC 62051]|nr:hypothetical protein K438DRAFT_1933215 [Mycena galopus ATCC 62051]